jgi:hypothetical protein
MYNISNSGYTCLGVMKLDFSPEAPALCFSKWNYSPSGETLYISMKNNGSSSVKIAVTANLLWVKNNNYLHLYTNGYLITYVKAIINNFKLLIIVFYYIANNYILPVGKSRFYV